MSRPNNRVKLPAIKIGLENEGLPVNIQSILSEIVKTVTTKMPIWHKIGGPEARYDAFYALKNGSDGIIAAMIESPYAYKKFWEMSSYIREIEGKDFLRGVNLESISAVSNIEEIASVMKETPPDLIVIGRGDLAKSMGKSVDSQEVMESALKIASTVKKSCPETFLALGGGITPDFPEGPWDALSTRFFLIPKDRESVEEAIKTEIYILEQLLSVTQGKLKKDIQKRISTLNSRLSR